MIGSSFSIIRIRVSRAAPVNSPPHVRSNYRMHDPILRLCEHLVERGCVALPALARMIFVMRGTVTIAGRSLGDGEAWHGEGPVTLVPAMGARASGDGRSRQDVQTCRRRNCLACAPGRSCPRLFTRCRTASSFCAAQCCLSCRRLRPLHRHQGPGIRCLIEGGIRIDTHGSSDFLWTGQRVV